MCDVRMRTQKSIGGETILWVLCARPLILNVPLSAHCWFSKKEAKKHLQKGCFL
jgi:hypothetical protein